MKIPLGNKADPRPLIQQALALLALSSLLISNIVNAAGPAASPAFDPLLQAALAHNKVALYKHLEAGNSLDQHDEKGRSLVLRVTMANDMDALRLLIELGADVDYYQSKLAGGVIDQTAFLYAGAKGMNTALELLIDAGARTDIYNYYGGTALIPAAEKGHLKAVRLLLERSSTDVNHVNKLGWTALLEAIILSDGGPIHQQIVALLLAHGADSRITDNDGISALEHTQEKGFYKIAKLLRQSRSPQRTSAPASIASP